MRIPFARNPSAFLRDDPYIDRDAVFGTKQSLVADFVQHEPGIAPDGTSVDEPFHPLQWTFTLVRKTTQR